MLPYFKIPKITRAQERRKEQELRAIIKTLARNKMKVPNKLKSAGKVFAPFNTIIVKSEPPPHLLTAQDWFSDLAVNLDDEQKQEMAKVLDQDPYFSAFDLSIDGDYDIHLFDVHSDGYSSYHGYMSNWSHYSILDVYGKVHSFLSESVFMDTDSSRQSGFSQVHLKDGRIAWVCRILDLYYVLNILKNGKCLVQGRNKHGIFFIDDEDIKLPSDGKLEYEEKFVVNGVYTAIADKHIEEGNTWTITGREDGSIQAELSEPNSEIEHFLNEIGRNLTTAINSTVWSDSLFRKDTLAQIFAITDEIDIHTGLKPSTIAMLYELQDLGYLELQER